MDANLTFTIGEIAVSVLLVVGGTFALVGSWGLVKLPDLMTRLHAPTKATTLGVGGCLLAAMGHFVLTEGRFSVHQLAITLFLFITAPITANMVAKAFMHRNQALKEQLPPTGRERGWATYSPPPGQETGADKVD
jgi:multicomponent K+:H+ antiporter subunit G